MDKNNEFAKKTKIKHDKQSIYVRTFVFLNIYSAIKFMCHVIYNPFQHHI